MNDNEIIAIMFDALVMVRDADDDCKKDSLPTMPTFARQKLDRAIEICEIKPVVGRPLFLEERKRKPQKDIAAKSRSALSKLYGN